MKKKLFILSMVVLVLVVCVCVSVKTEAQTETMEAVVTEIYEGTMIVCTDSGEPVSIGLSDITDGSEPEIGDTYRIEYVGGIMESYPAQVASNKVELVSKSE
ncbi:DUF3221 domain-containing protein [Pseudobutyrivibrio xylanivorans]|uniref:DUF3221 domain-containing protein n=1 Tax=Pseudobutyrivibrio xylanivorans TaxID=185007 RepID=A0A1G5RQH6_PSEXY|nr:DUF3221 domain-containing protein [Pseudobutyrivibrio xylanivorans]SCZ76264.1 hypothetical protein SAMN02910350_00164 [Pseudobutyrivibrio xylanivorans]